MIVVINPNGNPGNSFKGLNAYLAHDVDHAATSERLDWVDSRNLAVNDPAQAWKIMAATAMQQDELKKAAGIKAGRKSKHGAVDHIVMSFHEDEPHTKEEMLAAADELLASIGAKKSNRKNGKKRTQFANEHQAIIYAHNDGGAPHLHIMLNRIHPEHGVRLPDNNDQLKASAWAEKYMDRHNINACHNRKINNAARKKGEYVKADNRVKRNIYEQQKNAANDNKHFQAVRDAQKKKDAALAQRGRDLATKQAQAWDTLSVQHKARKSDLIADKNRAINVAKAEIREDFRPKWQELYSRQQAEIKTFEALEQNFFGRAKNMAHTTAMLREHVRGESFGSMLSRGFKILSSAGARREAFDKAQEAARKALQREQAQKVAEATKQAKDTLQRKLVKNTGLFEEGRSQLMLEQAAENAKLKAQWRQRSQERAAAWNKAKSDAEHREKTKHDFESASSRPSSSYEDSLRARYAQKANNSTEQKQQAAHEQDNENESDRG